MLVSEIINILEAEYVGDDRSRNKDIDIAYASDLMSDVLTFIDSGALLLTGLTNVQVIRTAEMAEIAVICFVRGKKPPEETVALARRNNIPFLTTKFSMYETCGRLFKAGLSRDDSE